MKLYVANWAVNKRTYEEFLNFLVDIGFDVSVSGHNVCAVNGSRNAKMFKGFKCSREMLALSRRFAEYLK